MIDTTISNFGTPQVAAYAGVTNIFLLTLFIMAIAPGSGGKFEQSGVESLEDSLTSKATSIPSSHFRR